MEKKEMLELVREYLYRDSLDEVERKILLKLYLNYIKLNNIKVKNIDNLDKLEDKIYYVDDKYISDIDKINIVYDSLAELIKKIGGYPIMNLEEIKNVSTVKEISSKDYTTQDVNSILLKDLTLINSMNNQVGEYALKNYDLSSINLVLDFNKYLSKRIWFLKMDK